MPDSLLCRIEYLDRKRAWWTLSVVYPLLPLLGLAAHAATDNQIALGLPLLISYGLMPILDFLIGEDENNPPEQVVAALDQDRYYRLLTWAAVPLHFVALIACAWWVGTHALSWWGVLLVAYVAGTDSGLGLNTGHELGHKHNPIEQWLARLVLAVPAYGHFTVEHVRGHKVRSLVDPICPSCRAPRYIRAYGVPVIAAGEPPVDTLEITGGDVVAGPGEYPWIGLIAGDGIAAAHKRKKFGGVSLTSLNPVVYEADLDPALARLLREPDLLRQAIDAG